MFDTFHLCVKKQKTLSNKKIITYNIKLCMYKISLGGQIGKQEVLYGRSEELWSEVDLLVADTFTYL